MPVVPSNNPYYCREAGRHDCPMHVQLSISSSAAHSETHWLDHRLDPLSVVVVEVLFYVHRNRRFIRDAGAQDVQLDVRTAPEFSSTVFFSCTLRISMVPVLDCPALVASVLSIVSGLD